MPHTVFNPKNQPAHAHPYCKTQPRRSPLNSHKLTITPTAIYKATAEALKGVDNLVIANMDGTANEFFHEGVEVKGYPTLAFFAASPDGKAKIPKYYDGASGDAASFAAWLAKHVKAAKIDTAALDLPKPALKSEPAPTAEEAAASAVVTAVGSTVEALSLDPT